MSEESFLLVSLEEAKAKKLAQVLSNDTSRKILDYLSKKDDATETEISEKMEIPLSTVHYNLKQLVEANLVNADEFHYSKKGKEILHYTLSNKYVIIAPRSTEKLKEKLKQFLPVVAVIGAASLAIDLAFRERAPEMLMASRDVMLEEAPAGARMAIEESATAPPNYAIWFLIGGFFALLVFVLWNSIIKKK